MDRVRAGYDDERRRREKELRERHQVVQIRRQMLERVKQREKMRLTLDAAGEDDMKATLAMSAVTQKQIANERLETRNKIDIFEIAFRKIKEATGVSDVNEVIQKITTQESTTENLITLTRENQSKLEMLNEMKRKLKIHVEEIKYSGVGGGHRRKMIDDHEEQVANSVTRLERSRVKYERLNNTIVAMKAGVGHLQDKLESSREEVGGKKLELNDETVAEVLRECELCLTNITRRIKAADDEKKRSRMTSTAIIRKDETKADYKEDPEFNMSTIRPYNQRIDLESTEDVGFDADNDDEGGHDVDDEELTREKIKQASSQILHAKEKAKRKVKVVSNKKDDGAKATGTH